MRVVGVAALLVLAAAVVDASPSHCEHVHPFVPGACIRCTPGAGTSGYHPVSGVCTPCAPNEFSSTGHVCASCPYGCSACATDATCTACEHGGSFDGFEMSAGRCYPCQPQEFTSVAHESCTACGEPMPGCTACSDEASCAECTAGVGADAYGLVDGTCSQCLPSQTSNGTAPCESCSPHCDTCATATTCAACQRGGGSSGYELSDGSCTACADDEYSPDGVSCVACGEGCKSCTAAGVCTLCAAGISLQSYGLQSGECHQCTIDQVSTGTSPCQECSDAVPGCMYCASASLCERCASNLRDGWWGLKRTSGSYGVCERCGPTEVSQGLAECTECSATVAHCLQCRAAGVCAVCQTGDGAAGYQPNGRRCVACAADEWSDGTRCVPCADEASFGSGQAGARGEDGSGSCVACLANEYRGAGSPSCVACPSKCEACGSSACDRCAQGFTVGTNGTCAPCTTKSGGSCGSPSTKPAPLITIAVVAGGVVLAAAVVCAVTHNTTLWGSTGTKAMAAPTSTKAVAPLPVRVDVAPADPPAAGR